MVFCSGCFKKIVKGSEFCDECREDIPTPKKWKPYARAEELERLHSDKKLFPPDKEGITWERVKMPFKPYPPSQGV